MKQRMDDQIHRLPDGRKLAYAEYGDAHGTPVLLVHGNPGSRLFWGLHPDSPVVRAFASSHLTALASACPTLAPAGQLRTGLMMS